MLAIVSGLYFYLNASASIFYVIPVFLAGIGCWTITEYLLHRITSVTKSLNFGVLGIFNINKEMIAIHQAMGAAFSKKHITYRKIFE